MRIILASRSPRRSELLERMGLTDFIVHPAEGEESADPSLPPGALVEALSRAKARQVAALYDPDDVIIAADTLVFAGGQAIGKPRDAQHAAEILRTLSGKTHMVYTGFTLRRGEREESAHEGTEVRFRTLSEAEIAAYIASGEPMDKAGAYGVQGLGGLLVEGVTGDYFNVVGLPVCKLGMRLRTFGVPVLGTTGKGNGP